MLFPIFWYQIFENLIKIELWGIFRVKYIFMVENFIFQILNALGLEYFTLKILQSSISLDFQIIGTKMFGKALSILKMYIIR